MADTQHHLPTPRARRLKIGFVGNTNNYPFLVATALHRMGHDVTVLLDRPETLHRPEGRYPDLDLRAEEWIQDVSGEVAIDRWRPRRPVALSDRALRAYDLLVLNGYGPALAGNHGVPAFAMLTGSDLTQLANWSSLRVLWRDLSASLGVLRAAVACLLHARTVRLQRRAIEAAFGVSYFVRGIVPEGDRVLDSIGVLPERRLSFMLSDVDHIDPNRPTHGGPELRVFNVARLNWRRPKPDHLSDLDMKGTDVLLRGFAAFREHTGLPARLILVRKGVDVEATEQEVQRLGIGSHVTWLAEMSQAQVFEQYALADVVAEQLSTSYVGMGGLDAMAAGRPVIANTRRDARVEGLLEESPVLHATTPQEVCDHLTKLARSPQWRGQLGKASRRYVEERHSPKAAAQRIIDLHARHALHLEAA